MKIKGLSPKSAGLKFAYLIIHLVFVFLFFEGTSRILISNHRFFKRICGYDDDSTWRLDWIRAHHNIKYDSYAFMMPTEAGQ